MLTGTVMNGYASSLFTNLWAVSPKFREEFDRADLQPFIDRYGYRKRMVEDHDAETGEVIEFNCVVRVDTPMEGAFLSKGGILPYVLGNLC